MLEPCDNTAITNQTTNMLTIAIAVDFAVLLEPRIHEIPLFVVIAASDHGGGGVL